MLYHEMIELVSDFCPVKAAIFSNLSLAIRKVDRPNQVIILTISDRLANYEYRISYCYLTRRIDASLHMGTNVDEGKVLPWQELLEECVDVVIALKNKQEKEIEEFGKDFV